MKLLKEDQAQIVDRYSNRFKQFGYSPKTLGWDKGKQDIRFTILTSQYNFKDKTILDIGCGFGDFNNILQKKVGDNYRYVGIDIVPVLIEKAKTLYNGNNIQFICDDFLSHNFNEGFDYIIASGIFNFKLSIGSNYSFIENIIKKSFKLCYDGFAFDFLSDKVDYKYEKTFHSSPEKILKTAFKYSRNIVLRNDYMPFEFSLFVFKDDSFKKSDTVFSRYKSL